MRPQVVEQAGGIITLGNFRNEPAAEADERGVHRHRQPHEPQRVGHVPTQVSHILLEWRRPVADHLGVCQLERLPHRLDTVDQDTVEVEYHRT